MTKNEIVSYWIDSSETDFQAMDNLFKNKHYIWSLFIGHLVIEKLLKAFYVKNNCEEVPRTHDLLKLADKAKLDLHEEQKDFLDEVTTFNIKARYPDYKNRFQKKATSRFTGDYIKKIKEFRLWILNRLNN
ncbi:MAG: HEPN domain-containing protein [Pseudomonadota bacterium]|nr:HEPN domain-containing protein [Pseudomonadota bacterium]